jgi:hypothetical protein
MRGTAVPARSNDEIFMVSVRPLENMNIDNAKLPDWFRGGTVAPCGTFIKNGARSLKNMEKCHLGDYI